MRPCRTSLPWLPVLAGWLSTGALQAEAPAPGTTLTNVVAIRSLTRDEATHPYPVRLQGVLTFVDPRWPMVFLHDGSAGTFLLGDGVAEQAASGHRVEIEGRVRPGGFAPLVEVERLVALGAGSWPPAIHPDPTRWRSGQLDSQWIELTGVVQHVVEGEGGLWLKVHGPLAEFDALLGPGINRETAERWLDASVRLQGVAATSFTEQAQLISPRLLIPGLDQVIVERPPPVDPWATPVRQPAHLLAYHPNDPVDHRVRVRGTVTHVRSDGVTFLQDGADGLRVELADDLRPRVGTPIEVLGFPRPGFYGPTLRYARFRPDAPAPGPPPQALAIDQLQHRHHARLVTLRARLQSIHPQEGHFLLMLIHDPDGLLAARLSDQAISPLDRSVTPGSLLQLTGVYEAHSDQPAGVASRTLWVQSSQDLHVVEPGPWWNLTRALTLAGTLAGAFLLAGLWGGFLQRKVRRQSDRLKEQLEHKLNLERRYRELTERAADLIYTTDLEGRLLTWNRAVERFMPRDRAAGSLNVLQAVVPEDQERVRERLRQRATSDEDLSPFELTVLTPDGTRVVLEATTRRVERSGEATVFETVARDITARRAAEDALRQAHDELEQRVAARTAELRAANAQLSEFAYAVTHDLRAPLRGVSQLADWIAKDHADQLGTEGTAMFRLLQNRVQQMHQLVGGILAYTQVGRTEGAAANEMEIDLNWLVGNVVSLLSLPTTMKVSVPVPLPTVRGLREQLHQIFQNLFDNAVKHHDQPAGIIEITARRHSASWEFRVQDDGPGIAPQYHEKIFQIFQRLQLRGQGEGTGIGLALVRRIVEVRGGRLWVESKEGAGATFAFTWPDSATTSPNDSQNAADSVAADLHQ